jgi:hypothetical protein
MSDRISDNIPKGLRSENRVFTEGLIERFPEEASEAGVD